MKLTNNTLLSSTVRVIHPDSGAEKQPDAPTMIILCTWMDASPKHILKYTTGYQTLYPSATIIIISSVYPDFLYRSRAAQKACLEPTVPFLAEDLSKARILVHLFSNGGVLGFVNLCDVFEKNTGKVLPVQSLVLDSCPGRASLSRGSAALLQNLPKQWYLSLPMTAALYPLFFIFWLYTRLQPSDILETIRKELNDEALVTTSAPRLYMYTTRDEIASSDDIEDHIAISQKLGYSVDSVKFDNGCHVGLLRDNSEEYWMLIKDHWEDGDGSSFRPVRSNTI
ncbi:DUF829-domain-containing protein [Fusarium austroafricanum]|uniref:DUF829-domain-containing protein n=1 Tax=Fusarium austroafricanum TaxID=2364996 RepID=A0A8H4JQF3_9HYPO|nr:DUF829-domain-containing protein [Fusarium austroafricanum]